MNGPPYRHAGSPPDLTTEDLREPVRALLADPDAQVRDLHCTPVSYESWSRASDGLYVVRGTAWSGGTPRTWELVLKQVRRRTWTPTRRDLARQIDDGGDGPADWAYWRREELALNSPLLKAVTTGRFTAPRCLGVVPSADGGLRLWLERVDGTPADAWQAGELLDAAEALGGFHARSLRQQPEEQAWFCRPFVEQAALYERFALVDRVAEAATGSDRLLRDLFSPLAAEWLCVLRDRHAEVVRRLRALPTALVHRDLTPRNLFRSADRTVAIDWGQTGLGPPGEDLATLVLSSAVADGLGPEDTLSLGSAALARHRTGLAEEGRQEDPESVALAYRLVAAYHFGLPLARIADRLLRLRGTAGGEAAEDPATRRRVAVMTALLAEAQADLSVLARG